MDMVTPAKARSAASVHATRSQFFRAGAMAGMLAAVCRSIRTSPMACGQNFGFTLKPAHSIGVARELIGKDFDRHIALQFRISRPIDLAHPATAYECRHFKRAELCADCDVHG